MAASASSDRSSGRGKKGAVQGAGGGRGFYDRQFQSLEVQDLNTNTTNDLLDEVAMLRVYSRRVLEMAAGIEDLQEAIKVLDTLGMAANRLAYLLKTQHSMGKGTDEVEAAISGALADVIKEMGLK